MIFQDQPEIVGFVIKLGLFLGISILILIFQRLFQTLFVGYLAKSNRISLEMLNSLKLVARLGSLIIIFYLTLILFESSLESLLGFSAILGAIISFGFVQWISNFIAGLYLLLLRPFSINDFIQFNDEIRGTVEELSLNYTKIKTVNGVYHYIPNKIAIGSSLMLFYGSKKRIVTSESLKKPVKGQTKLVFRKIARYLIDERIIRYTFLWGAPLGDLKSAKLKLLEVCEIYAGVFGYRPEFYLESIGLRMNFKFIISTLNVNLLVKNIHDFRNDVTEAFH